MESEGYKVNKYDLCVANKIINSKQYTIIWHVDNLMALHVDAQVNWQFVEWIKSKYENKDIGEVKVKYGKVPHIWEWLSVLKKTIN